MYLERLGVFDYDNNPYYKPNGEFNTRSATDPLAMGNCTMFAFLWMHEACELEKRINDWIRKSGGFGNAKTWYDTTTLPKGSEIRTGSIAVFDGNCGHVAPVVRKVDDKHGYLIESNFTENKALRDWHFFNCRGITELEVGKATIKGCGKLLGFIYLPIHDIRVDRDTTKYQVQVTEEKVNVRKTANYGELVSKGCYCPMGIYNVVSVIVDAEGYKWYELEKGHWIREGHWTVDLPADSSELEQLRKENTELKARLEEIGKAGGWIHG